MEELLERKRNTPETGLVPRITVLNDYIERELASLESAAASMEKDQPVGYETLNKAFLAILRGAVPK